MKKIKIGIVTFHRAHNYGAMLQAYALCNILNQDYNAELIDYYNKHIYSNYNIIRPFSKNPIITFKNFKDDLKYKKVKEQRWDSFESFLNKKCNLSKRFNSINSLKKEKLNYDIMITGSDQVWNPNIVGELSDIYTLNFGNKNIKRVSYAASVGNRKYICERKNEYIKKLDLIDELSVREDDAKKELEQILNKDVNVVLDPTLLLTKEEWDTQLLDQNKIDDKYILAYMVKYDKKIIDIVNKLSEKTGLKVVHFDIKNPGYNNVLASCYNLGPLEFINYIKNAQFVVTTSFHATVFSLIYEKEFLIVPHSITGSRVNDLLKKIGILDRSISSVKDFERISFEKRINYNNVNKILENERFKSITWLKKAIEK